MEQYAKLLWENELRANKLVAKAARIIYYLAFIMYLLNVLDVFSAPDQLILKLNVLLIMPLFLPTILVEVLKCEKEWVSHTILLCIVIATGISYMLLTFQVILIFVLPTIVTMLYFRKKYVWIVIVESIIAILISHFLSFFFVAQPWMEPFYDLKMIMLYGAFPRVLQYGCCGMMAMSVCHQMERLMQQYYETIVQTQKLNMEMQISKERARYEVREAMSRELHHSVGHTITTAIMTLDAAEALCEKNPLEAKVRIGLANKRMRGSLEAIRKVIHGQNTLEKKVDQHLDYNHLEKQIEQCIQQFEKETATMVRFKKYSGSNSYCDEAGACLEGACGASEGVASRLTDYRLSRNWCKEMLQIVQELLTNSAKHGRATAIIVMMGINQHKIYLRVQDNGEGNNKKENNEQESDVGKLQYRKGYSGFGLESIRQWIQAQQGEMVCSIDEGFCVEIWIPLEGNEEIQNEHKNTISR